MHLERCPSPVGVQHVFASQRGGASLTRDAPPTAHRDKRITHTYKPASGWANIAARRPPPHIRSRLSRLEPGPTRLPEESALALALGARRRGARRTHAARDTNVACKTARKKACTRAQAPSRSSEAHCALQATRTPHTAQDPSNPSPPNPLITGTPPAPLPHPTYVPPAPSGLSPAATTAGACEAPSMTPYAEALSLDTPFGHGPSERARPPDCSHASRAPPTLCSSPHPPC